MRPSELLGRLLHNWPIKLAAVLTALVLWYQLREVEPVVERSLERPLEVVGLGEDRAVVGLPKTVTVRFRGTARIVENLNPGAVVVFIDLSGVNGGPFAANVQVRAPSGVQIAEVVPAKVEARIERLGAGVLPVEVYAPGSAVAFEPDSVEMRGPASLVERASASGSEKVVSLLGYQVKEILGEERVKGIIIESKEDGGPRELQVEGVFIEIGLLPNSDPASGLVELNKEGEIIVDCACRTDVPEKQIIVAAGEGAKAALSAYNYLLQSEEGKDGHPE